MPTTAELKSQELFSPSQASRSVALGQESFEPSGTGHETWVTATNATERRTLADHLAWRVNVLDFGAAADGVTDDTDALNDAFASGSSHVYMPAGAYLFTSPLTVPDYVRVEGSGSSMTRLVGDFATGDAVTIGIGTRLEHLKVRHSVVRTSGYSVLMSGNNGQIENCEITDYYIAIGMIGANAASTIGVAVKDCVIYSPATYVAGSGGIKANFTHSSYISGLTISGPFSAVSPEFGVYIGYGDTFFLTDTNIVGHGQALVIAPAAGDVTTAFTSSGCFYDSCTNAAATCSSAKIDPAVTGVVLATKFSNCWFGGSQNHGMVINPGGTVDGVIFDNCQFPNNANSGLRILGTNVRNVSVIGGYASGNVLGAGVNISGGTTDFIVNGMIAGNAAGGAANGRGIWVEAGTSDNYIITNNLCMGNTTAGVTDAGTGVNKVVANNVS